MNILFLSGWYPFPPRNGSELRIFNLLGALTSRHQVTLLALQDPEDPRSNEQTLPNVRVRSAPRRPYRPNSLRALLGLFGTVPRALVDTYVADMEALIKQELESHNYDLVIASELRMAAYRSAFEDHPSIFEDLELGVYQSKQAQASNGLKRLRHQAAWFKLRAYLRRIVPRFGAVTVVSERERELLRATLSGEVRIEVVPNGVDVPDQEIETLDWSAPSLIYTGSMTYFANFDAMSWFVSEIFPLVRLQIPGARLLITGDPGERPLPEAEGVELTGFVEDVRPLLASADVSVVPLRLGGGTRLKILEAMALETAVVSTSKGAEGLELESEVHLLIKDQPKAFAEGIVRLLHQRELRERLISNARRLVAERYDWSVIVPAFVRLAEETAQDHTPIVEADSL